MAKAAVFPIWTNPAIVLFHGTTQNHVAAIIAGVNVGVGRNACDFGQGFYTTTSLIQARRWAKLLAARNGQQPAVIRFSVDRNALAALEFMAFVRKDRHASDFWSLVRHCRLGHGHSRAGGANYDVVIGPVAKQWRFQQVAFRDYDQLSFHTNAAANLLNKSNPAVIP